MKLAQIEKDIARYERKQAEEIPKRFTEFCAWVGITLTPGQRALCRVVFDGEEPRGESMFGLDGGKAITSVPAAARAVIAAVCGARGGKSYVLVALRLVWGMMTRDLSSLAPGQHGVSLVVAPDLRLSREVVNYARGIINGSPPLRACLGQDSTESLTMTRPDGKVASFLALPATRGGSALRGRSLIDAALDESAFFRDDSFVVNDIELFKAVRPRVLPGGQVIVASTPWTRTGLLYDLFSSNWGNPQSAIAVHAPTLMLNDSKWVQEIVGIERARDPENAKREFDAEFMAADARSFFDDHTLESATEDYPLPRLPGPGMTTASGADFGFRSDSSALIIAHKDHNNVIYVAEVLEQQPVLGVPLKPSDVVKDFAARVRAHGGTYVMADQHYRESISEHLDVHGLVYIPAPTTPSEAYIKARQMVREGRIKLPKHPRLLRQLREVQVRPTSGGGVSIVLPRYRTGGHGDLASAFVLALAQLHDHSMTGEVVNPPAKRGGDPDWEAHQRDLRRAKVAQTNEVPSWDRRNRGRR